MEKMNNITAIKTFFEKDGGRKVSMDEMKALTRDDRAELGRLAAEQLGVQIEIMPAK